MIEHDEICQLIPHAGNMCLLDRVLRWDQTTIECETSSHMLPDNPLRRDGNFPIVNLVEYGAQAMAVHGGLLAREQGHTISNGYLAALRDVQIHNTDISHISGKLNIVAENLMAQGGNMIYQFYVIAGNERIMEGRVTVVEVA